MQEKNRESNQKNAQKEPSEQKNQKKRPQVTAAPARNTPGRRFYVASPVCVYRKIISMISSTGSRQSCSSHSSTMAKIPCR